MLLSFWEQTFINPYQFYLWYSAHVRASTGGVETSEMNCTHRLPCHLFDLESRHSHLFFAYLLLVFFIRSSMGMFLVILYCAKVHDLILFQFLFSNMGLYCICTMVSMDIKISSMMAYLISHSFFFNKDMYHASAQSRENYKTAWTTNYLIFLKVILIVNGYLPFSYSN